jgi:hypothetical protein
MGVCIGVDVEGITELEVMEPDGKGLADIIGELTSGEECLTGQLAEKYSIDISPLKLVSDTEDPLGPWQNPANLWRAAHGLYEAFIKEGNSLLGKKLFYREITLVDMKYYLEELKAVIEVCKFAHENKKRVRLSFW